jgi:3-deoxy-D-manno-octulosonic-acid transferase
VLANARISDTSARRWRRFGGPIRAMLARFSAITVPEARMAQVLAGLGADPARITVAGSLKRGADRLPVDLRERAALAAAMGARPRWLAASTHPGEEEVVAAAQRLLLAGDPATLLVLAPRHPDRGAAVAALLAQAGLSVARRSAGEAITSGTQVYLADTLGEMGLWFDLCPVAFVGGSLVAVGGHNAYEPVAHGAAVLTGPQVGNFADLYARLVAAGGARVVADAAGLAQAVAALGQPAARQAMADAARAAIAAEGDGTATTAAIILSALGRGAGAGAPSPA